MPRNTPKTTALERSRRRWGLGGARAGAPVSEALREAARAALDDEKRAEARRGLIRAWTVRLRRLGRLAKAAAELIGGIATVGGAIAGLYHYVSSRRAVAPAELPATGVASTAVDRVDPPAAPDGSDHGAQK